MKSFAFRNRSKSIHSFISYRKRQEAGANRYQWVPEVVAHSLAIENTFWTFSAWWRRILVLLVSTSLWSGTGWKDQLLLLRGGKECDNSELLRWLPGGAGTAGLCSSPLESGGQEDQLMQKCQRQKGAASGSGLASEHQRLRRL